MAYEKKPAILKNYNPGGRDLEELSFDTVLDTTCERLWERHIQYSIRRIRELDEELEGFEKELEQFLRQLACRRQLADRRQLAGRRHNMDQA